MRLRAVWVIVALALGIISARLPADAQQLAKVSRVGYLSASPGRAVDFFRQRLGELGFVERRKLIIEYRWTGMQFERAPDRQVSAADHVRSQGFRDGWRSDVVWIQRRGDVAARR